MPFLIKNIKPNRQPVIVRNEGTVYDLAHNEQVILDIRNITSEMFLQSMRGEITTLYVGRMPAVKVSAEAPVSETPEPVLAVEETATEVVAPEPQEETKPNSKKSKA